MGLWMGLCRGGSYRGPCGCYVYWIGCPNFLLVEKAMKLLCALCLDRQKNWPGLMAEPIEAITILGGYAVCASCFEENKEELLDD